ncbi:CFEM-domain-containing protein [Aaosphaeria arxii CBS 175.79]|uniref:CFEM-domain-containing protein n=1 Tax=Aaosphaeria arxii CBS 175.79 TaxID=1450172 RepID=A0A6A5XUP1_9PLEO|nr:CFEM-domain-containing protein [Aaosphaeria arxii CBS 175.79]KAF2016922.1 CFEM-domain-containing protein [Aaosphaeria arxii CBS 175.79]
MKTFAILAVAGIAAAQSLSDLPPCGQTCINNMVGIATSQFGCAVGDVSCYCNEARFGYGVRDCSNQACPSGDDANRVIAYGLNYCANVGASQSGGSATQAPASTGALPILSSALASVTDSAGSVIASATDSAGSAIASATGSAGSALSSVTGSAGSALSSATGSIASDASSVASSLASGASSAASSLQSGASSAASSVASSLGSALSSFLSEVSSATQSLAESTGTAASSSVPGAAPMMTGMPVAGVVGGVAAWLLL